MHTNQIKELLQNISDIDEGNIIDNKRVQDIQIEGETALILIEIDPSKADQYEPIRQKAEALLSKHGKAQVILTASKEFQAAPPKTVKPPVHENLKPEGIKHIICVASGKGGVGKSTVAAHLALSFSKQGLKIGLMDADIYGPSVPKVFGLESFKVALNEDKKLDPAEAQGLKLMSIGFLVDPETPMIWRGPMVQSALRQFFVDVEWGELDVLVVDMPPGTGDAQLTMAQKVPLSGAIIVSTPQDIALIDARKAIEMFKKTNVPILGLVENMSTHICANCGHEEHLFGHDGAKQIAVQNDIPILAEIPLSLTLRESMDSGEITALDTLENVYEKILDALA